MLGRAGMSRQSGDEAWQADQVVGCDIEGEHPSDLVDASVSGFSEARTLLDPAEAFLDAFAYALAGCVAGMACRAPIDREASPAGVLCHVRRHADLAQVGYVSSRIIGFVRA